MDFYWDTLAAIWIGSVKVFGYARAPSLWDQEDMLPEATEEGKKWSTWKKVGFGTDAFGSTDEIFMEGYNGGHDMLQSCRQNLQITDDSTPDFWAELIRTATETEDPGFSLITLRILAIRLAKSSPEVLPSWYKGKLPFSALGSLWRASISVFGSFIGVHSVPFSSSQPSLSPGQIKVPPSGVHFADTAPATKRGIRNCLQQSLKPLRHPTHRLKSLKLNKRNPTLSVGLL